MFQFGTQCEDWLDFLWHSILADNWQLPWITFVHAEQLENKMIYIFRWTSMPAFIFSHIGMMLVLQLCGSSICKKHMFFWMAKQKWNYLVCISEFTDLTRYQVSLIFLHFYCIYVFLLQNYQWQFLIYFIHQV